MQFSIGRKLVFVGIIALGLVFLIAATSQVVVNIFKKTSAKLVVEYVELDAILEFKLSLNQLHQPVSRYAVYGDPEIEHLFSAMLSQAQYNLALCQQSVTKVHNHNLLQSYSSKIQTIDSLATIMFSLDQSLEHEAILLYMEKITSEINHGVGKIDMLLMETKLEIDEYSDKNETMIKHSTITVIGLSIVVFLIMLIGGFLFIRSITKPIQDLVSATENISKGGLLEKVTFNSKDELGTLAQSFNTMVVSLQNTTVSRNYLTRILENMYDALIVTDISGRISLFNPATTKLMGYTNIELPNKNINDLFQNLEDVDGDENSKLTNILQKQKLINTETFLYSKTAKKIPVSLSAAVLQDEFGQAEQMIMVIHDLTAQYAIAEKLESERKKRLIAINEAQEEERFRVAIDLHDGLGQVLTAISYNLQEAILSGSLNTEEYKSHLINRVQEQMDAAIKETKSLAHNLIPIVLKDFGLITAISRLIDQANGLHETTFTFNAYDFNERVETKIEKALYRICQEAVNNIVKHAKAKLANFQLFRHESSLVLVIDDDGIGFDTEEYGNTPEKKGIGLVAMRERVLAFDGEISIDSQLHSGTEIIIEIPSKKN